MILRHCYLIERKIGQCPLIRPPIDPVWNVKKVHSYVRSLNICDSVENLQYFLKHIIYWILLAKIREFLISGVRMLLKNRKTNFIRCSLRWTLFRNIYLRNIHMTKISKGSMPMAAPRRWILGMSIENVSLRFLI